MNRWVLQHEESIIMVAITCAVISFALFFVADNVVAQAQPAAPVDAEECLHVATADTIKIYYCEDIGLFVNQFGFMAFEP